MGSLSHNLLEYYAYLSSPWPYAIIPVKVTSNCPTPKIILLATWNFGSVVFTWSILSWITHKFWSLSMVQAFAWFLMQNVLFSTLVHILLHHYYFFPNFNIKSLKDSHTIHFTKTYPLFCRFVLKWCLFLNLFIVDWEIPSMFNFLLICKNVMKKTRTINLILHNTWQYFTLITKLINQHTYTNFGKKAKSQYSHIMNT